MQTTTVVISHAQSILAMDSQYFHWHEGFTRVLNKYPARKWIDEVPGHLVIARRHELEKDPARRQILPYIIVRQRGRDGVLRYLPYRRTKKGGEPGLHDMVSIGYGGHIDLRDVVSDEGSVIHLESTIMESAQREMKKEELRARSGADAERFDAVELRFADEFILAHFDVHLVHLGVLMLADLPPDLEIESAEDQIVSMRPMSARELLASGFPIEYWSQVYLEAHADD